MSAVTVVLGDGDDHLAGHLLMGGHVLVLAADGDGPLKGAVALLVVVVGRLAREGGGVASIADTTGEGDGGVDGHGRHGHGGGSGCNGHDGGRSLMNLHLCLHLSLNLHLLALVDTAQTRKFRLGLGIARPLEAGALDAGAGDALGKEGHAAEEVLVVVPAVVPAAGQPLEAVQVELPLEAGDLGLLEVVRHDRGDEVLGLVDGKGPAVGEPRDDVGVAVPLDLVEDVMELAGEGDFDAAVAVVGTRRRRRQGGLDAAAAPLALAAGHVVKADGLLDLLRRRFGRNVRLRRDLVGAVVVVVLDEVPDVALGGEAGLLRLAGSLGRRLGGGNVHPLDVLSLEGLEFFSPRRSSNDGGGRGSSSSFSEIDGLLRTSIADNSRLLLLLLLLLNGRRDVNVENVKGGVGVGVGKGNGSKGSAVPGIDELLPLLLLVLGGSVDRPG